MIPNLKFATLSAKALSDSLKIGLKSAKNIFANAIEYESWDSYIKDEMIKPHDLYDKDIGADLSENRLHIFANSISKSLGISIQSSLELSKSINPFSGEDPRPYRIEITEDSEGYIDLHKLMETVGGKDAMLQTLHSMAESNPELAMLKDISSFDEFEDKMRVSLPVYPECFYNFIEDMTDWEIDDSHYNDEYIYLEESFHLISQVDGVSYPVFLTSLTAIPGDANDNMASGIKETIQELNGRALVLFRTPVFKKFHDDTYTVIGLFYNGKSWTWTLLTELDPESQSKLISEDNFDLESPILDRSFRECSYKEIPGHLVYQAIVNDFVDEECTRLELPNPENIQTVIGTGGWKSLIL